MQETAALAGITTRVYPHLLRHSVATTLLERGMPLEQIQQFLGHTKLETTQIYAASTTAMIKESYLVISVKSEQILGRRVSNRCEA